MKDEELNKIFNSNSYKEFIKKNIYNTIDFLLQNGIEFNIVAYTDFIEFSPPIPKSIIEFNQKALFIISNYTFESAKLTQNFLTFEAGFGVENFASTLKVPLEAIFQVAIDDVLITINYYEPKKEDIGISKSMDILLNNPENQKLLNKKSNKK